MKPEDLIELVPDVYWLRDVEQGGPLRALVELVAAQVAALENDIRQTYDNWFIETCEDWVVPYLGELVGWRPVEQAGLPGDPTTPAGQALGRVQAPRSEVGDLAHNRRRKGTLSILEDLARDVAGWRARAVDTAAIGSMLDVRKLAELRRLGTPFETVARFADLRRATVRLHVWRLESFRVPRCAADGGTTCHPRAFTFDISGHSTPLFHPAEEETDPLALASERNFSAAITLAAFAAKPQHYYRPRGSFYIWASEGVGKRLEPVLIERILPAVLRGSHWRDFQAPAGRVAVDPERGRIVFGPPPPSAAGAPAVPAVFPAASSAPKVVVRYHYGFSHAIGGGTYPRRLTEPADAVVYRIGRRGSIQDAVDLWKKEKLSPQAVIELTQSGVYRLSGTRSLPGSIHIHLGDGESLQLRAAKGARPVLRIEEGKIEFKVEGTPGARLTLDGLLVVDGAPILFENGTGTGCGFAVTLRHCTFAPQFAGGARCRADALIFGRVPGGISISHCITGPIVFELPPPPSDPIPVEIHDSILDPAGSGSSILPTPRCPLAHVQLTLRRCTVLGAVDVYEVALVENCILDAPLSVARSQEGCVRFSYVHPGGHPPRHRYHCQPETDPSTVAPEFNSRRYGQPDYCQLSAISPEEIARGANDEGEMGVFFQLRNPQRAALLQARLEEFVPAGLGAEIIFST